jgi:hypothetical protein
MRRQRKLEVGALDILTVIPLCCMHCFVVIMLCTLFTTPNGCYPFKGKCSDERVDEYSKRKCWSMRERCGIGPFGIRGGVVCGGHKSTSGTQQFFILGVH